MQIEPGPHLDCIPRRLPYVPCPIFQQTRSDRVELAKQVDAVPRSAHTCLFGTRSCQPQRPRAATPRRWCCGPVVRPHLSSVRDTTHEGHSASSVRWGAGSCVLGESKSPPRQHARDRGSPLPSDPTKCLRRKRGAPSRGLPAPHPGRSDGSQQSPALGACRCCDEIVLRGTRRMSGSRKWP